jgi:mono/diheme cytochrome c family protein
MPLLAAAAPLSQTYPTVVIRADGPQLTRGKYLVEISGCGHCHTPRHFFGRDDMGRYLAGSDVGFTLPDGSTVLGRNLTPDLGTGLGSWSIPDIVRAIRSGVRPDGRLLSPVMPWADYNTLTDGDARAIAVYLKSLPPIRHEVPGPFSPDQKPTTFHISMLPLPANP